MRNVAKSIVVIQDRLVIGVVDAPISEQEQADMMNELLRQRVSDVMCDKSMTLDDLVEKSGVLIKAKPEYREENGERSVIGVVNAYAYIEGAMDCTYIDVQICNVTDSDGTYRLR